MKLNNTSTKGKTFKRRLTRSTKIRKRIFGVTSLVLALLVANIPARSLAEDDNRFLPWSNGNHYDEDSKYWSLALGSDETDPKDGLSSKVYVFVEDDSTLNTGDALNEINLNNVYKSQFKATDIKLFDLYYRTQPMGSSGEAAPPVATDAAVAGIWNENKAILYLALNGLDSLITATDYWSTALSEDYGVYPMLFRREKAGGNDDWKEYEGKHVDSSNTTHKYDERYTFRVYKNDTALAIAYRNQMQVEFAQASTVPPLASAKNKEANANYKLKMWELPGESIKAEIKRLPGAPADNFLNNSFYSVDMSLTGPLFGGDPVASIQESNLVADMRANAGAASYTDKMAVSIPLPSSMSVASTVGAESKYKVYMLQEDGSVREINSFYVVNADNNISAIQFATDRIDQVAIVKIDGSSGGGGGGSTEKVTITGIPNNSAYGRVEGSATVNKGSTVNLTAVPNTNYEFVNWTKNTADGAVAGTNTTLSVVANENSTYYANFKQISVPAGNVRITVIANPSTGGNAVITSNNSTVATIQSGKEYRVKATPKTGYNFVCWKIDGNVVGTNTEYSDIATGNVVITAEFSEIINYSIKVTDERENTESLTYLPTEPVVSKYDGTLTSNENIIVKSGNATNLFDKLRLKQVEIGYNAAVPFEINTNVTSSISNVQIKDLPMPDTGIYNDPTQWKMEVWYLKSDGKLGKLKDVNASADFKEDAKDGNAKVTFTISDMAATEYAFVYKSAGAAKTLVVDAKDGIVASASTDETKLERVKVLTISDVDTTAADNHLKANGVVYDTIVKYNFAMTDYIDKNMDTSVKNVTTNVLLPKVKSTHKVVPGSVKIYKQTSSGYTEITNFRTSEKETGYEVSFEMKDSGDYNCDYVFVFSQAREYSFKTDDSRGNDTKGGVASSAVPHYKPSYTMNQDHRIRIVDDPDPATIKRFIENSQYKGWNVIPYEIDFVTLDDSGNITGNVDENVYSDVTIKLTLPKKDGGLRDARVVAVNKERNALEEPTQKRTEKPNDMIEFTAKHFSEYAVVYRDPAKSYKVEVSVPNGGGKVTGDVSDGSSKTFEEGKTVRVVATPAANYVFRRWTDANNNEVSKSPTYEFTVKGDTTLKAIFEYSAGANSGASNSSTAKSGSSTSSSKSSSGVSSSSTSHSSSCNCSNTGANGGGNGTGSNANNMPKTGMFGPYKIIGTVLLSMFGIIELLSSVTLKRRIRQA